MLKHQEALGVWTKHPQWSIKQAVLESLFIPTDLTLYDLTDLPQRVSSPSDPIFLSDFCFLEPLL